ncbi:hypothetical protein LOTGIDRAFT_114561 [Lottia gigantea]|uniref:Lysozyme g n=1 Tax=Lottia gigantea TaxID=225164 RepID=V4C8V0_LOTGI|nr:hypothetical protein LOTGIDRAFT_114561 [Lottia gigantea]ESO98179.1 hypothetical protein LOTGIDRAFT_114561 [Lottia gigantea]
MCHGDFMKLMPKGADQRTARQDNLAYAGVRASNKLVDNDLAELNKRKDCYVQAGKNHCIHPAVIAAIASRETRGGKLLYSTNGYGDGGRAYGIMQVYICKKYPWDSCEHINQLTDIILLNYVNQMKTKHPSWPAHYQLKGGVSAYNAGVGNVQTIAGMDAGTTNDDYSNDVIARAQRLVNAHGW